MIALARKPMLKWVHAFMVLLLIAFLLPISPALAKPSAQDSQPLVKRLPVNPASDTNPHQLLNTLTGDSFLQDPSFEASLFSNAYWTQFSTNFGPVGIVCSTPECGSDTSTGPRTGLNWAWFGGVNFAFPGMTSPEVGDIYQYVAFPAASCTATLQFYFWVGAAQSGSDVNDKFMALIDGQVVFSANATQKSVYPGYKLVSLDVSRFANGGTHKVEFYSVISNQFVTFNLDDVSLTAKCAGAIKGDYNGDRKKDIAVFRPSSSTWFIYGVGSFIYGTTNDIPVSADYNGDGITDIAIFRPSNSTWYIRGVGEFLYGAPGDIPVVGDYNGDGKADIAIFRPSNSTWYIHGVGDFLYGAPGDVPVVADYNGDGKADIAIFRPSNSTWYIHGVGDFLYGAPGDVPVVADYNGDGKADIAIFRASNSTWYIRGVGDFLYGAPGDIPV